MEPAEHPDAALAGNFDRFFLQDLADECGDAGILRVKAVRAHVEMEVPVVKGPGQPAHDGVALEDSDRAPFDGKAIADGEAGYTGARYGDGPHRGPLIRHRVNRDVRVAIHRHELGRVPVELRYRACAERRSLDVVDIDVIDLEGPGNGPCPSRICRAV
jgi:hypothetical protein